jgi:hypothetical protein
VVLLRAPLFRPGFSSTTCGSRVWYLGDLSFPEDMPLYPWGHLGPNASVFDTNEPLQHLSDSEGPLSIPKGCCYLRTSPAKKMKPGAKRLIPEPSENFFMSYECKVCLENPQTHQPNVSRFQLMRLGAGLMDFQTWAHLLWCKGTPFTFYSSVNVCFVAAGAHQGAADTIESSHLCGNGECLEPTHVVYENHDSNMSRVSCHDDNSKPCGCRAGEKTTPCYNELTTRPNDARLELHVSFCCHLECELTPIAH